MVMLLRYFRPYGAVFVTIQIQRMNRQGLTGIELSALHINAVYFSIIFENRIESTVIESLYKVN
jgi:hypothetical protein